MTDFQIKFIQKQFEDISLEIIALRAANEVMRKAFDEIAPSMPPKAQETIAQFETNVAKLMKAREPSWKKFRDDTARMLAKS